MDRHQQWVAYRDGPGAMLRAPLPSAPEAGPGWRGVATRRWLPLDQFDDLVFDTVSKLDAAIGVAVMDEGWAYAIAAERGGEPVRVVLGVDLAAPSQVAAEVVARCGVSGSGKRWRSQRAKALAAWSTQGPRSVTAAEMHGVLSATADPAEAVSVLLDLLGIELPAEPIPDVHELHSVARDKMGEGSGQPRRWFARR